VSKMPNYFKLVYSEKKSNQGTVNSSSTFALAAAVALLTAQRAISQPGEGPSQMIFQRPQPVSEPTAHVAELIERLSDESLTNRQAAAKMLLEMGPVIEPQLRWALQHEKPSPEAFVRLKNGSYSSQLTPEILLSRPAPNELNVLISHLVAMRHLQTTRVTLHCRNEPLTNVLSELGRQMGADTRIGSRFLGSLDWIQTNRLALNLDRATYWEARQTLGKRFGLATSYNQVNEPQWIKSYADIPREIDASLRSPPATVSGPLQIKASSIELNRLVDYSEGKQSTSVKLALEATAEPKLWYTGRHAMVRLDECLDDRGQSLIADDKRVFAAVEGYARWYWKVPMQLGAPRPGGRIKTLKGQFKVAVCVKQTYLTITDLLHAQGQFREYDGLRMTVAKAIADHESYQIEVELSAPTSSPYAATFSDSAGWDVSLYDVSRQAMGLGSVDGMWLSCFVPFWAELRQEKQFAPPEVGRRFGGVRQEAGRDIASWTLIMSKRKTPATLLWLTPEETRWLTVPFELRDIPVPWSASK
jgi:hypothetical protein